MRKLTVDDIVDLRAYERERDDFRTHVIALKKSRRIALGDLITIVFENADTMRFQIQEMARAEKMLRDEQIEHEVATYNELIPEPGELSATLFVEYQDKDEREHMLVALAGLEDKFRLRVGPELLSALPDERGTESGRTMAVHYIKFPLTPSALAALNAGTADVALEVVHPQYTACTPLAAATLQSLRDDLA